MDAPLAWVIETAVPSTIPTRHRSLRLDCCEPSQPSGSRSALDHDRDDVPRVPPKSPRPVEVRRFEAIEVMAKDGLPVQTASRILEVSESGFYEWRNRPPSERPLRHAWMTQLITEAHVASNGTYGARGVHARIYPWHSGAVK